MWNNIIGHKKQIEQLRRTHASGKAHHAYLFAGCEGIGKRQVAHAFAGELLGTNSIKPHPEKLEISVLEDDTGILIDAIRGVKDRLRFAPQDTKARVIIINDAHLMTDGAQNAALKILEEPPEKNHFILITSLPNKLRPTILSRSQRIDFSPLTTGEVAEYLMKEKSFARDEAVTAAKFSEGSIGRAISLSPELIGEVSAELHKLMKQTTAEGVLKLSDEWKADEANYSNILYIVSRWFHDALLGREPIKKEHGEIVEIIKKRNTADRMAEKIELINSAEESLSRPYNKQLMFEQLLFTLAS